MSRLKTQRAAQWQTKLCHRVPRLRVSPRLLYDFGCAFSALVRLRARPSSENMRCLTQAPCRICKEKAKANGSAQCKDCKKEISSLRYWAKKDNMNQLIDLVLEEPVLCSFLTFVAEMRRDRRSTVQAHGPDSRVTISSWHVYRLLWWMSVSAARTLGTYKPPWHLYLVWVHDAYPPLREKLEPCHTRMKSLPRMLRFTVCVHARACLLPFSGVTQESIWHMEMAKQLVAGQPPLKPLPAGEESKTAVATPAVPPLGNVEGEASPQHGQNSSISRKRKRDD